MFRLGIVAMVCGLLGACASEAPHVRSGNAGAEPLLRPEPFSVADVDAQYQRLAGKRIRVAAFLIFDGRAAVLQTGAPRAPGEVEVEGPRRFTHWCLGRGDYSWSLDVAGLSRQDRRQFPPTPRHPEGELVVRGQRAVVEGVLAVGGDVGERTSYVGVPIGSMGPLENARVVAVEDVHCDALLRP